MFHQNQTRPLGAAGLGENASFDEECNSNNAPKAHVSQAKIDLLTDEIYHSASALSSTLNVLSAGYEAADVAVQIHALRQSQRYWRFISALARELIAAEAERASAFRQGVSP
jgi:hypothetical protein